MDDWTKFVAGIDWQNVIVAAIFLGLGALLNEVIHRRRSRVRWQVEYVTVSNEGRKGPILYVRNAGDETAYRVRAAAVWGLGEAKIRTTERESIEPGGAFGLRDEDTDRAVEEDAIAKPKRRRDARFHKVEMTWSEGNKRKKRSSRVSIHL